ncbi:MAG: leucine--tRNA ligase [Patescibacteria group bacterium]
MAEIKEKYDHQKLDAKWQAYWEKHKIFATNETGEKKYVLDMFPYPSGEGLHVGHPEGYIASDITSHYYRLKGFNVLHPMGFDAFGLPAENAAIKKGIPPAENTAKNIQRFKEQLNMLGFSYDWSRQVVTSDPEYYKWTQWLFLELYKNGLAYQKEAFVNWCPNDKTVLANEQVVGGCCERCGTAVVQEKRKQWFFKITDFAEDLLNGLDKLDWPDSTKEIQRNWIGKKQGIDITYPIEGTNETIVCFTTRPDTNFGATFVVLAPEHPLVKKVMDEEIIPQGESYVQAVRDYYQQALSKTELERLEEGKKKTGVFTGFFAINNLNNKRLPIWVSDFVLAGFGTGAVVGVPGHDMRDFEFAKEFDLPIVRVVIGTDGDISPIERAEQVQEKNGTMINSEFLNGLPIHEATQRIMEWLEEKGQGKITVKYRLRDWLISRQRYWGAPIPILYDKNDQPIPVKEKDLPVMLPTDVEFRPTGESPLTYSEAFKKLPVGYPEAVRREYDTLDTFVCSSWYYLRYADPKNAKEFTGKEELAHWLPVDVYVGGAEHATGHLIFARFITKVLHKLGYIDFNEPFLKLRHQGMILGENGEKMSKSKGNVINPDEVVEGFGADALRMYEMFMGPFDQAKPWSTAGIEGIKKFLDRVYRLVQERVKLSQDNSKEGDLHRLIIKITGDIEEFHFNTAVSAFMIFVNSAIEDGASTNWLEDFVILLAPFAPHLAEELWQNILKKPDSVFKAKWPGADPAKAKLDKVIIIVQEQGKKRGSLEVPAGADEAVVINLLKQDAKLAGFAEKSQYKFVPDKIINFY